MRLSNACTQRICPQTLQSRGITGQSGMRGDVTSKQPYSQFGQNRQVADGDVHAHVPYELTPRD